MKRKQNWPWSSRSYSAKTGEWSDRPGFSRHRSAGHEVSKKYGGYTIYTSGDAWKTSLDPNSDFDSEMDVKEFIKHWNMETRKKKFNPGLIDQLRGRFTRNLPKRNPGEAESLDEGFHGRPPSDDIFIIEQEMYIPDQAVIGLLEEMVIVSENGLYKTTISFKHYDHRSNFSGNGNEKDTVYITFPTRNQIEFRGGDQHLPMEGDKNMDIAGPVFSICYWTDKHHLSDGTGFSSYHHCFGEESVKMNNDKPSQNKMLERMPFMPLLCYDRMNEKMILIGGSYTVEDVGIRN